MPQGLPIAALKIDAETEIRTILGGCSNPPKGEVDCVAQIIVNGVPAIAKAWAATLTTSSCKLTMRGVFCHGSPMVDHPPGSATNRCELADLLVVMDVTTGTTIDRTAALVQAKMDKGGSVAIGTGTPMRQLTLYKGWPTFAFASAAYHGRHRDFPAAIRPKIPTNAGRYGAIDLTLGSEDGGNLTRRHQSRSRPPGRRRSAISSRSWRMPNHITAWTPSIARGCRRLTSTIGHSRSRNCSTSPMP